VSVYTDHILPHLLDLSMRKGDFMPYRERVVSRAEGRVLEIGIGSGLNLPLYGSTVEAILGLEPAPGMMSMAQRAAARSGQAVTLIAGSAEAIPLEAHSVDTILTTWALCSITRADDALKEMRRVLRPNGQLLFVEHGLDHIVRAYSETRAPVSGHMPVSPGGPNTFRSGVLRDGRRDSLHAHGVAAPAQLRAVAPGLLLRGCFEVNAVLPHHAPAGRRRAFSGLRTGEVRAVRRAMLRRSHLCQLP